MSKREPRKSGHRNPASRIAASICRRRALDYATADCFGRRAAAVSKDVLGAAATYHAFLAGGDHDHDLRTKALDLARRLRSDSARAYVAVAKRFLVYLVEDGR